MKTSSYMTLFWASIATATLLSACKIENEVDIQGRAVKGVLRNAVVSLYTIDNGQFSSAPLSTTRTDTAGNYQLNLASVPAQPVAIIVTADQDTRMICDLDAGCTHNGSKVAFGADYPAPIDLRLRAIVPALVNGNNEVHVTPVSEMVAAKAYEHYASQSAILAAQNEWNLALRGFPSIDGSTQTASILTTRPINIADADEANHTTDAGIVMGFLCASAMRKAEVEFGGDLTKAIAQLDTDFVASGFEKYYLVAQMSALVKEYLAAHSGSDTPITRLFAIPFPSPGGGGGRGGGGGGGGPVSGGGMGGGTGGGGM